MRLERRQGRERFKINQRCPRCGGYLDWCVPTVAWLGYFECPECWVAWHHEIEEQKVGRFRRKKRYTRILVQGRPRRELAA